MVHTNLFYRLMNRIYLLEFHNLKYKIKQKYSQVGPPSLPPSGELYPGDHWSSGDPWHNYMAAQMAVTGGSYSAHQMYHSARYRSSLTFWQRDPRSALGFYVKIMTVEAMKTSSILWPRPLLRTFAWSRILNIVTDISNMLHVFHEMNKNEKFESTTSLL